jgi:polar amino acid transport system substrate-binding protein
MRSTDRRLVRLSSLAAAAVFTFAACTGSAPTVAPTTAPSVAAPSVAAPSAATPSSAAPSASASAAPVAGGLLDKIIKAGKIVVSTDPNYKPQSFLKPDGTFEGFDIDVANEIGKRLGVTVAFTTPSWDAITAGGWAGRWDISVGSMTITTQRQTVLDFSPAYYYTPAQMTATVASGITTLDGLAGKTVCVGSATTYADWLQGKLSSVSLGPVATPPAGVKVQTLDTDQSCAQAIDSGRKDAEGFLSSSTTVDAAIANGTKIIKVGDPVFTEQLAVSVDKSGPADTDFMAAVDQIVNDMHTDGTLSAMSMKWFSADLTTPPA